MVKITIYERGDTFSHWVTIRDRNKQKTDPSSVSITIYDPCSNTLVNSAAMTKSSTGLYYYDYGINSSATYGEYSIKVVSTSAGALDSVFKDEFFVMPWTLEKDIRRKMGVADEKDIDDEDLSHIAWTSYMQALRDVYRHHYADAPSGNPDTGTGFDGSNTTFQTKNYPIADITGDGSVTGTSSCATDITGWWIDSAGSRNECSINISNYKNGEISIYQSDGATAIPANNEGVYLDYWSEFNSYDEFLFREAVSYLAAHYVSLRFTARDKVTLADINSSKPIILKEPYRFLREYKRLITLVKKPRMVGVS